MRLYVGNLSYDMDEAQLRELFSAHGEVVSAAVISDRETGRSKGFGFVEFATAEAGNAAIQALDGKAIGSRQIKVNEARPQNSGGGGGGFRNSGGGGGGYRDRNSGGGGGGGRGGWR